jgi:hypothetical protein
MEFAPQLVRVMFEAIFDSEGTIIPATASSTACTTGLYKGVQCLLENDQSDIARAVNDVDTYAAQTEATVTSLASQLIRGAWFVALNNEALAKSLETMAGVISRKVVAKKMWQKVMENGCVPGANYAYVDVSS